jgi:hypothetical protein
MLLDVKEQKKSARAFRQGLFQETVLQTIDLGSILAAFVRSPTELFCKAKGLHVALGRTGEKKPPLGG